MPRFTTRHPLTLALLTSTLVACTVPGVGYVGAGDLPLDVLAVTASDAETGNTSYRVALKWSAAPGAKTYEVQRKFSDQAVKILTTTDKDSFIDTTLSAKQLANYKVRALGGDAKELKVSGEKSIAVLAQEVAKPDGLEPADNAALGIGELPLLKWKAVVNASWYYVRVARVSDDSTVFSAMTKETSIRFGDKSPLAFEKFADLFPVGTPGGIQKGIVHRWSVQAIRTDGGTDPALVKAVDVNSSAGFRFSQGQ